MGGIYRGEPFLTYEEQVPAIWAGPLVKQPLRLPLEEYEKIKDESI